MARTNLRERSTRSSATCSTPSAIHRSSAERIRRVARSRHAIINGRSLDHINEIYVTRSNVVSPDPGLSTCPGAGEKPCGKAEELPACAVDARCAPGAKLWKRNSRFPATNAVAKSLAEEHIPSHEVRGTRTRVLLGRRSRHGALTSLLEALAPLPPPGEAIAGERRTKNNPPTPFRSGEIEWPVQRPEPSEGACGG
jgi:hypothetical protein